MCFAVKRAILIGQIVLISFIAKLAGKYKHVGLFALLVIGVAGGSAAPMPVDKQQVPPPRDGGPITEGHPRQTPGEDGHVSAAGGTQERSKRV